MGGMRFTRERCFEVEEWPGEWPGGFYHAHDQLTGQRVVGREQCLCSALPTRMVDPEGVKRQN
jgi:hypothetical protein